MSDSVFVYSGINWTLGRDEDGFATAQPRCSKRRCCYQLRFSDRSSRFLSCGACGAKYKTQNPIGDMEHVVLGLIEASTFRGKDVEYVSLDGSLTPIEKISDKKSGFWVTAQLMETKIGDLQLMVVAGKHGQKDKAQIFLDLNNEKLTFDHKDLPPGEVFSVLRAVFKNSVASIESTKK